MKLSFLMTFLFLQVSLVQAQGVWLLQQQVEAPPSWKCSDEVKVIRNQSSLFVESTNGNIALNNLNGARICRNLNSSYIFGGVSCTEAKVQVLSQGNFLFEERRCQRDIGNGIPCSTNDENPSTIIRLTESQSLRVQQSTGWENHPNFICQYSFQNRGAN